MLTFVTTADGSKTLYHPEIGEHYHSRHGAVRESMHVFLNSGLRYLIDQTGQKAVSILEVGLGTGLNFLLTADDCTQNHIALSYTGIEAFPLAPEVITQTAYDQYVPAPLWKSFCENYPATLNAPIELNDYSTLHTAACKLLDFSSNSKYDVLYFDAFAAVHQPEMWDEESLAHVCGFLKPGGVFVTYAITGNLKRTMKGLGFSIEKAPGAPGKREMLRAVKNLSGSQEPDRLG